MKKTKWPVKPAVSRRPALYELGWVGSASYLTTAPHIYHNKPQQKDSEQENEATYESS